MAGPTLVRAQDPPGASDRGRQALHRAGQDRVRSAGRGRSGDRALRQGPAADRDRPALARRQMAGAAPVRLPASAPRHPGAPVRHQHGGTDRRPRHRSRHSLRPRPVGRSGKRIAVEERHLSGVRARPAHTRQADPRAARRAQLPAADRQRLDALGLRRVVRLAEGRRLSGSEDQVQPQPQFLEPADPGGDRRARHRHGQRHQCRRRPAPRPPHQADRLHREDRYRLFHRLRQERAEAAEDSGLPRLADATGERALRNLQGSKGRMKRLILGIAALVAASHLALAEEPRQRVMNIPLDMPLEQPLDGEFLEGIYQEKLADVLRDSVLIESPIPHIESKFTDNRALELWFSSAEDGRRVFWARLSQSLEGKELRPQDAVANFEATFGQPDKTAEVTGELGSFRILLKLDPRLSEARRATILKQLDSSFRPTPAQVADFGLADLRSRVRLLTPDFRGAVFFLTSFKGKVASMQTDLIDMVRAQTVLNLTAP